MRQASATAAVRRRVHSSGRSSESQQQPARLSRQSPQQPARPAGSSRRRARPGAPGPEGAVVAAAFRQPDPIDFQEHEGWTSLFDGKTLNGWSGDSNWKVEDGAITIESTCEKPTGTVYLVWQGGEAADFELKIEMKGTGSINGGVQYRGWIAPRPQRGSGAGGRPPAGGGAAPAARELRRHHPRVRRLRRRAGAPGGGPGRPAAAAATGPCPSGAPRGTPPMPKSEEQWNMWGAAVRLRRRQPLHGPVLRAVHRPRHRRVERAGRADRERQEPAPARHASASRP